MRRSEPCHRFQASDRVWPPTTSRILTTDYDLIVDVTFDDLDLAKGLLDHAAYQEATDLAAATTKYEWTARITHTMAAG